MARRGEVIENPLSGERLTFLKTTADTNGQSFEFEFVAPPGWSVSEHVHPRQQERTQLISGMLEGSVSGQEAKLGPGEVRVVPAGVAHVWSNPSDEEEARFSVEFSPALNMESGFETAWRLAREGKATASGMPKNPLQLAVIASAHKDEAYLTHPPIPVQKAMVGALSLLAPVGRALGYRARYPEYSGMEEPAVRDDESRSETTSKATGGVVATTVLAIFFVLFLLRRRSRASPRTSR
jgi:quercetin dioxygenase-like cupin family protein